MTSPSATEPPDTTADPAQRGGALGRSAALGVVSAVGRKVLAFIYSVLFVRIIGIDLYGIFVAFETVARPLGLIGAVGGQHLVVSEVVRAREERDERHVAAVVSGKILLTLCTGAVASLLVVAFASDLQRLLGGFPHLDGVFRTWSSWIVLLAVMTVLGGVLVGFGRSSSMFLLTNVVDPLARLAMLPVMWFLLHTIDGPWRVILIPDVFGTAVVVTAAFWLLRRAGVPALSLIDGWKEVPRIAILGIPLLAHNLASIAFAYSDRAMVGAMIGDPAALGVYNITLVLAGFLMLFHRSIVTVISSDVSTAVARKDMARVQALYRESAEISFLLAAVGYLWFVLFGREVLSIYDGSYAAYGVLLGVVTWGQLVDTFAGCGGYLLIARGKGRYLMYNSVLTVCLNIALNWFLIQHFGLMGAAVATALSYLVKNVLIVIENLVMDQLHPFTPYHVGMLTATILLALGLFALDPATIPLGYRVVCGAGLSGVALVTLARRSTILMPRLRRPARGRT